MVTLVYENELRIPTKFSEISFDELTVDHSFPSKYIRGRVHVAFPLKPYKNSHIKRLYITSDDNEKAMYVTLFGIYAEEFDRHDISVEDIIYVSGFSVETRTGPTSLPSVYSVCILIGGDDDLECEARVWAIKKSGPSRHLQSVAAVPASTVRSTSSTAHPRFARCPVSVVSSSTEGPNKCTSSTSTNDEASTSVAAKSSTVVSSTSEHREGGSAARKRSGNFQHCSAASSSSGSSAIPNDNDVNRVFGDVSAGPAQKKTRSVVYDYIKLNEATSGQVVNVFGVVKYFKPPFATRGRELCMVISLTDPSFTDANQKLKCNLFGNGPQLPQIRAVGDIIRLHRLKIVTYQGELQGQRAPGFSCLVWDGSVDASMEPQSTSDSYTISEQDFEKVRELRQWFNKEDNECLSQRADGTTADTTLNTAVMGAYFDICCQVIAKRVLEPRAVVLRVWDGTKIAYEARHETASEWPMCDRILMERAGDCFVDVYVFDDHCQAANAVKPGDFVKFVNLHAAKYKPPNDNSDFFFVPSVELVLHGGSKFGRCLKVVSADSVETATVRQRLENIQPRPELSQPSVFSLQAVDGECNVIMPPTSAAELSGGPLIPSVVHLPEDSLFYASSDLACAQQPQTTPESDNDIIAVLGEDADIQSNSVASTMQGVAPVHNDSGDTRISYEPSAGDEYTADRSTQYAGSKHSDSAFINELLEAIGSADEEAPAAEDALAPHTAEPDVAVNDGSLELISSQECMAIGDEADVSARSQESYLTCASSSPTKLDRPPRIELPPATLTSDTSRFRRTALDNRKQLSITATDNDAVNGIVGSNEHNDGSMRADEAREEDVNAAEQEVFATAAGGVDDVSRAVTETAANVGNNCMRVTATVTSSGRRQIPYTSIKRLLRGTVPDYFHVRVYLLAFYPDFANGRDFIQLFCPCCNFVSGLPQETSDTELSQPSSPSYSVDSQAFSNDTGGSVKRTPWWLVTHSRTVNGLTIYNCPKCFIALSKGSKVPQLQYIYRLNLLLADDSGHMTAQLAGAEAEKFFSTPAAEVVRDETVYHQLSHKMSIMCPSVLPASAVSPAKITDRPVLELCIASHYSNSCVFYNVFDTTLAVND